jgi:2-hydroxychromene-2-carboxylate isomerase
VREGLEVTQRDPMKGPDDAGGEERPVGFYFDLGSPYAYLAAERISRLFADAEVEQPEWRPILLGGLFKRFGRESWMLGPDREAGMREVERRAGEYGLQPVRWPDPCPANTLYAMRVATYAKSIGRSVSFALAAFRQAFAAGRDLTVRDNVAIAAAACELHPTAIERGSGTDQVRSKLRETTERAGDLGVRGVPSVLVGDRVFWGDEQLEAAVGAAIRLP